MFRKGSHTSSDRGRSEVSIGGTPLSETGREGVRYRFPDIVEGQQRRDSHNRKTEQETVDGTLVRCH